jgi:hypothetical protein
MQLLWQRIAFLLPDSLPTRVLLFLILNNAPAPRRPVLRAEARALIDFVNKWRFPFV